MKKNISFAVIFGAVFGLPLTALLVAYDVLSSHWDFPYVLVPVMAVLLVLRYMALLGRKAGEASGRAAARVAGRFRGGEAAAAVRPGIAAEEALLAQENYLQMLLSLPLGIGALLATAVAAAGPLAVLLLLVFLLGDAVDGVIWAMGLIIIAAGAAGIYWLRLLERFFGVRILLPLIPLSVVWAMYAIIAFGVFVLFISLFD